MKGKGVPKHVPLRSCVACRDNKPKRELVRVVRATPDRVEIDRTGKANGRGAYFCPAVECFEAGKKRRSLNHALQMTVSPDNWEELLAYAREALPETKVPTRVPSAPAGKDTRSKVVGDGQDRPARRRSGAQSAATATTN